MNKSNSPKKIKRYRLGVSRNFPTTHPRKGQNTWFREQIMLSLKPELDSFKKIGIGLYEYCTDKKLHTCRANYPLWEKRMKEVQEGRAVIELFYWSGKPYNSPQVVFATLDKDSGCGVQKLIFKEKTLFGEIAITPDKDIYHSYTIESIAKNDGLSLEDFKAWFKGYNLSDPMAIIQFTSFRY